MSDAVYFYASLYHFDAAARKAVIEEFRLKINDVSARCWYDGDQDVFHVVCPEDVGPKADDTMADIISDFIDLEIKAAEEEEREPRIRRFPESVFNDVTTTDVDREAPLAVASSSSLPDQDPVVRPVMHQIVHTYEAKASEKIFVKLFVMNDLPARLEERLLTPSSTNDKLIQKCRTVRAVKFDPDKKDYVFNGRTGQPVDVVDKPHIDQLLQSTRFKPLDDSRPGAQDQIHHDLRPVKHWNFQEGVDHPTVRQFLEGQVGTVLDEPGKRPEPSSDAMAFLARPTNQTNATGRARMPVGFSQIAGVPDEENEDGNDIEDPDATKASFLNLMKASGNSGDDTDDSSDDSNSSLSDAILDNGKPLFKSLVTRSGPTPAPAPSRVEAMPRPPVPLVHSSLVARTGPAKRSSSSEAQSSAQSGGMGPAGGVALRSPSKQQSVTQDEKFPVYNRQYANVDSLGLTSIAANQAAWEHENMLPQQKAKRSGVSRRPAPAPSRSMSPHPNGRSSAAVSMGDQGAQVYPTAVLSSQSSGERNRAAVIDEKPKGYADTKFNAEPWARRTVGKEVATGNLVDVSVPQSIGPIKEPKLPPGLVPGPTPAESHQQRPQLKSSASEKFTHGATSAQDLIDFREDTPPVATRTIKPANFNVKVPLQSTTNETETASRRNSDTVEERLQPVDESSQKRYTMRQKAKKGKNTSKAQSANKKAAPATNTKLDLPDPLPPPNKSKRPPEPVPVSKRKAKLQQRQQVEISEEDDIQDDVPATQSIEALNDQTAWKPATPSITELLSRVSNHEKAAAAHLEVRFGVYLMAPPTNRELRESACALEDFGYKLQNDEGASWAEFFPRLTSSTTDAHYLLDSLPGIQNNVSKFTTSIGYEIEVKNFDGHLRWIKFEQTDPEDFTIMIPNTELGILRMHYPAHVWDASVTIETSTTDEALAGAARAFISSIQTDDLDGKLPPSFKAQNPMGFSIERVYVKRHFFRFLDDGTTELRVTEAQDLGLSDLKEPMYNFGAVVDSRESMIEHKRLWWECGLRVPSLEQVDAERLRGYVDTMVAGMDGVGYDNEGWFYPNPEHGDSVSKLEAPIPFW